jgi:Coenzyme PQQ synthesis protein D (PqqD)
MSKNKFKPLSKKADIVIQKVGNEILIYDLKLNKAFSLNETSSIIWQACDGNKSVSEISNQISKEFNSSVNEEFVWFALEQFKKDNLIENESEFFTPFEGLSRREIIRKVGLTTVVALPVVFSLLVPTASQAASTACVTAGNLNCRCPCPATGIGSSCGQGTGGGVPNGLCNPNCICTRSAAACPTTGSIAGTALGTCNP